MPDLPSPQGRGSHLEPPNRFTQRWREIDRDALEEDDLRAMRNPKTTYLFDRSAGIVSENGSPDVPFRYSINPYRGCLHGCAYCLAGDTPILAADGMPRPLGMLRVGDEIYGTVLRGRYRRFTRTRVLAHWRTIKPAYRIRLADGTELVASADHRFLTQRGWKHVAPATVGQRPFLTVNNSLLGTGRFASAPARSPDYRRGYLTGMIRGDGLLRTYDYSGPRRQRETLYQFRLALVDRDALDRTADYLRVIGVQTHLRKFRKRTERRAEVGAIWACSRGAFARIKEEISWPGAPSLDWRKGYLAGLFDAEGAFHDSLRISNSDGDLLRQAEECLTALGFHFVYDVPKKPANVVVQTLRLRGGLRECLRFFHTVDNAIVRKRNVDGVALKSDADTRIVSIESLGVEMPMYDITTGTGDFIANGVVSHNCYARPTHEYLGYNAGLDFETKIVVKEDAPALFRDFLNRPGWRPEPIALSGVTDCYQPAERRFRLTRGCLEVAAEARQPMTLITKNALVLRDLDLLGEMAGRRLVHASISVTTLDAELARKMEPRTSTPAARLRAIGALAAGGVPVRVLVAPVIPGLNDSEIPAILQAAKEAGAHAAYYQLLRLPLTVAPVFREWLQRELPDRLERIEGRIRSTREGKLNDGAFGSRMRGTGPIAEQIRQLFRLFARRCGLDGALPEYDCGQFRRPRTRSGQLWLF
jgi:DNA repair photolyase